LYLTALRHEAQHFPLRAESHMRIILELHQAARLSGVSDFWAMLSTTADEMWSRVDPADPGREEARLYRGIGLIRRANVLTLAELEQAEQDLLVYAEANPTRDLAWAALAASRAIIVLKLDSEGQASSASERVEGVDGTMRVAMEAIPDGPHLNRVRLDWLLQKRGRGEDSVTDEELSAAVDRAEALALAADDPRLVEEVARTIRSLPEIDGLARAVDLLRRDLEQHPDDYKNRLLLVDTQYFAREFDDAYAAAGELMQAAPLKVSIMAQMQFFIRRSAAARRVDIGYQRWEQAPPQDKAAFLARIKEDHDALLALIGDTKGNPLAMKADAMLAMARNEIGVAAARLEEYLAAVDSDFEAFAYAAICQQRLGQMGLAHKHISDAVELQPRSMPLLVQKARLEIGMGRSGEAARTAGIARSIDPDDPQVVDLERQLAFRDRESGPTPDDPLSQAIFEAQDAFSRGDYDEARVPLLTVLETQPDDVRVLEALARIEFNAGLKDAAAEYLDRALAAEPNSQRLWGLKASLDNDDPIIVVEEYLKLSTSDEGDLAIALMLSMSELAKAQERLARQSEEQGNAVVADRARAVARQAQEKSDAAVARASELVPDHPKLIDHRFTLALDAGDWVEADRLVELARARNADQADGLLYRGRYAMVRGDFEEAARLLEQATARIGYSGLAWKGLAYCYQEIGRTVDALNAFEQAHQRNPNDLPTIRRYVPLLAQSGQMMRALDVVRPAARLAPDDRVIWNLWLGLESEVGDAPLALRLRRETFRAQPDDIENALSLATFLSETEPAPSLLIDAEGQALFSSMRWNGYPPSRRKEILEQARADWDAETNQILDALADREEAETLLLAAIRAQILRNRGEPAAGEQALRQFIERVPESERTAEIYISLGIYLSSVGRTEAAFEAMAAGVPYQDSVRLEADTALGNLYFETGDIERSIEHLERVHDSSGDREIALRLVECYARIGEIDEAERRLQEQIDLGGRDYLTWMLAATLADSRATQDFAGGQTTEGHRRIIERDEALKRAEQLDPSRVETYAAKARTALHDFRRTGSRTPLEKALQDLDHADSIDPGNVSISLVRVDIFLAMEDLISAMGELERVLEREPRSTVARQALIQLLVNQRDYDRAIAVVQDGEAVSPGSYLWPKMAGTLYATVRKDADAAAAAYRRAYQLQPEPSLLASMIDAEMGRAAPDYAFVRSQIEQNTALLEAVPVLRTLYARALDALGEREQALQEMRVAYQDDRANAAAQNEDPRNIPNWYLVLGMIFEGQAAEAEEFARSVAGDDADLHDDRWLAGLWASTGADGLRRAIELQNRAIAACPAERSTLRAALYQNLAQFHLGSDKFGPAAAALSEVIELMPDEASALNDFAYLTAEYLGDPAAALPYAERAVALQPRNPQFQDTLGWILFKLNDLTRSQRALLQSLEVMESAETLLHLAHVEIANGDPARAERTLRRAAESSPDTKTREEIERLLDDIRTRRSPGQ
ncbi:MAG: tetratricopeptide repeat protein, partial [Planctomycetota bacterium]